MDIWSDGRSGLVGCFAGNIALEAVSGQCEIRKLKGTTFSTPSQLIIGRVCASDHYLGASVLHWANVSWDQHCDLEREAKAEDKQLLYLFVTASGDPVSVHYWCVPADMVRLAIEQRGKNRRGATAAVHILASGERNLLGTTDVTSLYSVVDLDDEKSQLLEHLLKGRNASELRAANHAVQRQVPSYESISASADGVLIRRQMAAFDIPIAGARTARLSIPLPLATADLARLKGWIDLMADVLTEQTTPESEQARAAESQWLRREVEAGLQQLDRGEKVDGESAFNRILERPSAPHPTVR